MKIFLKVLGVIILITLFAWPLYLLLSGDPSFDDEAYDVYGQKDIHLKNYQIGFIGLPRFGMFSHGGGESGGFVVLANKEKQWLALHYTDWIAGSMIDYYGDDLNEIGYCRGGDTCDNFQLAQYSGKPSFLSKLSIYVNAVYFYWRYEALNFLILCAAAIILPIIWILFYFWHLISGIFSR